MESEHKPSSKPVFGILSVAGLLAVVLLVLGRALRSGLSLPEALGYLLLALAGYAVFLIGMPFFFWIVGEAGYRTFLEPYLRVWHIRRIRNRRSWDEVAGRGHSDSP